MKKGDSTIVFVFFLTLIAFLLLIVAFQIYSSKSITGSVIQDSLTLTNSSEQKTFISQPFFIDSFNIRNKNAILEITNIGNITYVIKKINIKKCQPQSANILLTPTQEYTFFILCPLIANTTFNQKITISYSKENTATILTAEGIVSEENP